MFALGLLTCIVLRAFSAQAKVVPSFDECKEFFYKNKAPEGMDQNAMKICQMYKDGQSTRSYYATLYSVRHRIPLYSAYRFDPLCIRDVGRTDNWHVEPQISQPQSQTEYMVPENVNNKNTYYKNQATSNDYCHTGYDRGHLNPNSFQCNNGRLATFTLTNAAPMDPRFNQRLWRRWESTLRSFLSDHLGRSRSSETAYIITGTVPDANVRIPQRQDSKETERVTVPSHIWTAVCYKDPHDNTQSVSFGFIGQNQMEGAISLMRVSELKNQLNQLYGLSSSIQIFEDDCVVNNNQFRKVQQYFNKLINQPQNQIQMSSNIQKKHNALKMTIGSNSQSNEVKVKEMRVILAFNSKQIFFDMNENLKLWYEIVCLIINAKPLRNEEELRKRDVTERSNAVECLLVPENQMTAADGSQCSRDPKSTDICKCKSGKPCCFSPCLYKHNLKGYRCDSGNTETVCSPRYSLVTIKGETCLDEHPCATYGYDYYWCKTKRGYFKDDWSYCSPPLRSSKAENGKYCRSNHGCAKYGESQPWCYTDDGKKKKCCVSDDCYSAVNDKTCRQDHPCAYHGYGYLWCYTDGKNNWDYCCKNCRP